LINLDDSSHECQTRIESCLGVRLKGSFGRGDSPVDIGGSSQRNRGDLLFTGRIDDFEVVGFVWTNPFRDEEKLAAVLL
jgi:hypothetical protein